ncbi:hypothetical protein BO71DRAFT_451091 [Aspergillus ellipticus CBS 707.79]|uniref:Uncharacterized protein n=1 Tax=Aspergillus ellipticus CBS 707.79 TaxID=1448320 RepID=A0A319D6E8_9EURO|nr:hypothetical protein BO71DRAFT_451091 [Aspergillus ellipticus CBS 707.79]
MCSPETLENFHNFLTISEATQICSRFHSDIWQPGCQVMWSGVRRNLVQTWADQRGMQTLTTAMGPLMVHNHARCLWSRKSSKEWSRYMKGASAIYAYHIAKDGGLVTEPILKGNLGLKVSKIEMVHPSIPGAEDFHYQIWPNDETTVWHNHFGYPPPATHWRHAVQRRALL